MIFTSIIHNDLIKGFYIDNYINRKLNRVGKEYYQHSEKNNEDLFTDYYNNDLKKQILQKLDKDSLKSLKQIEDNYKLGIDDLVKLSGGILNKNTKVKQFDIIKNKGGVYTLNITYNNLMVSRTMDLENRKFIRGLIDLKDVDDKIKGLGTKNFYQTIKYAQQYGFKEFQIKATGEYGNVDLNGYKIWPKLGFDFDKNNKYHKDEWEKFTYLISTSDNPDIKNSKSVTDLYKTKEGKEFWNQQGFTFHSTFKFDSKKQNNILNNWYKDYITKFTNN